MSLSPDQPAFPLLPANFLGLRQNLLETSAAKQRSIADLQRGVGDLTLNFVTVEGFIDNYVIPAEDQDETRHIQRGVALAHLLLHDSIPGFSKHTGRLIDTKIGEHTADSLMAAQRGFLYADSHWRLTKPEVEQLVGQYNKQVDEVLIKAGFGDLFEIAVHNLTGSSLEDTTELPHAKYGAALLALGIAINV